MLPNFLSSPSLFWFLLPQGGSTSRETTPSGPFTISHSANQFISVPVPKKKKKEGLWWESDFSHQKFASEKPWIHSNYFVLILTGVKNISFYAGRVSFQKQNFPNFLSFKKKKPKPELCLGIDCFPKHFVILLLKLVQFISINIL